MLNDTRRKIVRNAYLQTIEEHATELECLARIIREAVHHRDLTGSELAQRTRLGNLSYEEAGIVYTFPSLDSVRELDNTLSSAVSALRSCFED